MEKKSNTTARDIKRRLEVITTKMEDLKKLGVPCAFVHVSYWSGGLLVNGDPKITGIIQGQAQEILDELNSCVRIRMKRKLLMIIIQASAFLHFQLHCKN